MCTICLHAQETPRERELLNRIDSLEKRLADVEAKLSLLAGAPPIAKTPETPPPAPPAVIANEAEAGVNGFFRDTTLSATVDGYYEYNFNHPADRLNQLRGFDQSSNSFSLNQATIVLERTPNIEAGRRFGGRIDLQFGQATQTLQGSTANELRPEIYRAIYQAYGTYVFPIGKGLQTDFGKFASSLGYETNYTKDQMNYSRSYWFNYLPYYHLGFRTNYNFNSTVSAQYWLVNGANQSEDFNGFKSQAFLLVLKPAKSLTWNATYYVGQESRQPSLTAADGRAHIFDTYINWTPANSKWSAALEGDYTINRSSTQAAPARVDGGAAYLQYQAAPKFALAGRFELLQDRAGYFSGRSQTIKEFTLTGTRQFADGFQAKLEYRRDFSSTNYFATGAAGLLKRNQDTALLGLIWWFGGKTGSW
jgi:Putative beta-barrel porin-2, OmpL-like. bbp2